MKELGPDKFVTFMCVGVACRLKDEGFFKKLEYFMK